MTHTTTPAPARTDDARRFWAYWGASTVSRTGDAVTAVALPLVAVGLLGATDFEVGLVVAASYVAWLLVGLPAGVIVGSLPLRGTQVALDLFRAVAVLAIPVAAWLDVLALWHLVAVAVAVGVATVLFDVGNSTYITSIVPKEQLTARNSLTSATNSGVELGGPSLAGLLVQLLGAAAALVVDAVSYLVSAALLARLPRSDAAVRVVGRPVELVREGLVFVWGHPLIRPCVAAATLVNLAAGALMALTPVLLVRDLGVPVGWVGLLVATGGLGSMVGAAVTTRAAERLGSARAVVVGAAVAAASLLLVPFTAPGAGLVLYALGNAGFACGVVVLSVLTRTHRQVVTPPELLPRVMATVRFVSWGAIPFGALGAGALSSASDARTALFATFVVAAATPCVLLASGVGRVRDLWT